MRSLSDEKYVKELQSNLHRIFNTVEGKEVMEFLEEVCGWYDSVFNPDSSDLTLINDGKRQVVATLKTLLRYPAETIVKLTKQKEEI